MEYGLGCALYCSAVVAGGSLGTTAVRQSGSQAVRQSGRSATGAVKGPWQRRMSKGARCKA